MSSVLLGETDEMRKPIETVAFVSEHGFVCDADRATRLIGESYQRGKEEILFVIRKLKPTTFGDEKKWKLLLEIIGENQ